jgi:hypothetical protein
LNSKGEVFDIRDADFDFSMVENLYTFGPEYNGIQVAFVAFNNNMEFDHGYYFKGTSQSRNFFCS